MTLPTEILKVTIDAPVEVVWPWLAQLGQDRWLLKLRVAREPRRLRDEERRPHPSGVAASRAGRDRPPAPGGRAEGQRV